MLTALSQLSDPWFHALPLILVAGAAVQCLVAIWAGRSSWHWFVRVAAIWGAIMLLVQLKAYEPVWLFVAASPLIVGLLGLHGRLQRMRKAKAAGLEENDAPRYRFAIRDLLLVLLLVGMSLAGLLPVVRQYQPENWLGWIVMVLTVAGIAALADMMVASRERRARNVFALLLFIGVMSGALYAVGDGLEMTGYFGAFSVPGGHVGSLMLLAWTGLELALVIGVIDYFARASVLGEASWRRVAVRAVLALMLLGLALPLGYFYVRLARQAPQVPKLVVENNPYDRIVAIAERTNQLNPSNAAVVNGGPTAMPAATTAELTQLYDELLPLLESPNAVDYDPETDAQLTWVTVGGVNHIQSARALARCLDAEAEAARLSGNHDRAADYALATTQLGAMLRRGGIAVDAFVGLAVEEVGHHKLSRLRADLSPAKAGEIQATLVKIETEREPHAVLYAREEAYNDRAFGWRVRLESLVEEWRFDWREQFERGVHRAVATRQLLQADLAIGLFQHERGTLPQTLDDLVPGYLPAVPIDPYSGQPLTYRPAGSSFVLYSIGYDGHDDGGSFVSRSTYWNGLAAEQPGYDFDLDTLTRP